MAGRGIYDRDEVFTEKDRKLGERAKDRWWPLFTKWVVNHLNDPVLSLEAAYMDGFRDGRKSIRQENSSLSESDVS